MYDVRKGHTMFDVRIFGHKKSRFDFVETAFFMKNFAKGTPQYKRHFLSTNASITFNYLKINPLRSVHRTSNFVHPFPYIVHPTSYITPALLPKCCHTNGGILGT
jgi:hypothetical protein